jgi:enoyl-CoA hydratase/carnithine racemase
MTEHVRIERDGGVLTLTLNRPERKNALTQAMYRALGEAIAGADDDHSVRAILLQGEGDLFSSGNDIADFAAANADGVRGLDAAILLNALARARTPVIAAVHGRTIGVGVTLLLHCDLVFLAEGTTLTTPFADLAVTPEAASSLLLPARIGHVRAFSMFVLGEPVAAETALAWGLANAVVPVAELRARALAAAQAVASKPRQAVEITKALMREPDAVADRIAQEIGHFTDRLRSPEAAEAFQAFAQKRRPDYSKFD